MKKTIFFISILFVFIFSFSDKADANVCLLASEDGAAAGNCDSGSPSHSAIKYDSKTYSKAKFEREEDRTSCDNVNKFADIKQAKEYALSHEFDDGLGNIDVGTSACYTPACKYSSQSGCKSGTGGPCCKSLVNNKCWRKCNICQFNNINKVFYPYADKKMEECKLIGEGGLDYHSSVYTNNRSVPSYKIHAIRNIVPVTYDEEKKIGRIAGTEVWTCRPENFVTILTECINASNTAEIIVGFDQKTTYPGHLCIDGRDTTIPADTSNAVATLKSFITQFGGCPASAIKCDASAVSYFNRYYPTAYDCEHAPGRIGSNPCAVVETYSDFGDTQCWHGTRQCSDFGHGEYITSTYDGLKCEADYNPSELPIKLKNTEKQYYYKSGTTTIVEMNGEKCGACECKTGFTRISECNDVFYDKTSGYYKAADRCNTSGYTVTAGNVSRNDCEACPYSALYWKCP